MPRPTSNRIFPLALAAALLTLAPLAAEAQRFGHGPDGAFGRGFLMGRMAERLQLDAGQRERIHDIFEAGRDAAEPLLIERARLHRELGDAIHAEAYDEAAVRDVAARLGETGVELALLRAAAVQEAMAVLTPEQRAEARELHEERGDLRGRRHGRFGRGRGGPPSFGE